jgi:GAF domain
MSQRLSPDRRSFKQFLSTLFQQIQMPGLRGSAEDRIDPQWLPGLTQIRQEVKGGRFDLNAIVNRLTKLIQGVVGAGGAGVWLFTNDEVFLYAGAGTASNDERLRLEVLSKLASACQLSQDSTSGLASPTAIGTGYDARDLGDANSLVVEPIYQGHNVAGALAVFSDECNAFSERAGANLPSLADLLAQALNKAAEAGLQDSVALEPAAMLQLIERIIPALQRMLESDGSVRHSTRRFLRSESGHELPGAAIPPNPFSDSHEPGPEAGAMEAVGGIQTGFVQAAPAPLGDSASPSLLREVSAPRFGVWAVWQSKLAGVSTLGPVIRQNWERTVAWATNYASRIATAALYTVFVQRGLRNAQDSFLRVMKLTNTRLQMLLQSRSNRSTLLRAAPVMAILVITVTFLILKRKTDLTQIAASNSPTTARETTVPLSAVEADAREAPVAEPFGTSAATQMSHMHITDRATENAVRTLSRYEMAGLRRRAEYGDDSAAFQVGMAYEIGRGVHNGVQLLPNGSREQLVKAIPRPNTISDCAIATVTECRRMKRKP